MSFIFTFLGLILQVLFLFFDFLYFFDSNFMKLDFYLYIYLILIIFIIEQILKQANWQSYKANINNIKLRL